MAEPILNSPRIMPCVRQSEAAGMPEHVSMYLVKSSTLTNALYEPIDSIGSEGSASLGREDESGVGKLPAKLAQRPNLIATKRMHRGLAILDTPDMQGSRSPQLDLRPFQIADFGSPQAVPERDQDQRSVAVTISAVPSSLD
jgi:hypothetical protein